VQRGANLAPEAGSVASHTAGRSWREMATAVDGEVCSTRVPTRYRKTDSSDTTKQFLQLHLCCILDAKFERHSILVATVLLDPQPHRRGNPEGDRSPRCTSSAVISGFRGCHRVALVTRIEPVAGCKAQYT
jgi:hypothetical protein